MNLQLQKRVLSHSSIKNTLALILKSKTVGFELVLDIFSPAKEAYSKKALLSPLLPGSTWSLAEDTLLRENYCSLEIIPQKTPNRRNT